MSAAHFQSAISINKLLPPPTSGTPAVAFMVTGEITACSLLYSLQGRGSNAVPIATNYFKTNWMPNSLISPLYVLISLKNLILSSYLYSLPNITMVIKWKSDRMHGNVARFEYIGISYGLLWWQQWTFGCHKKLNFMTVSLWRRALVRGVSYFICYGTDEKCIEICGNSWKKYITWET
jgi:hypothetical protein